MASGASDGELVRSIAAQTAEARDAEALLCRRFAPRIRLYGLKHLRDEQRAGDLVQLTLLAVLQAARAGRIAEVEHVERFVLGTCRHLAQRMRESEARTQPLPDDERLHGVLEPEEPIDRAALSRCLGSLEERAKTVIHLSFIEQCAAEDIAATLSTSPGNVRVIRHRALAALRRCLEARAEG